MIKYKILSLIIQIYKLNLFKIILQIIYISALKKIKLAFKIWSKVKFITKLINLIDH